MKEHNKKLLDFIKQYINDNGYAPSYTEMMDGTGEKSKNGIFRKLNDLEEGGFIFRSSGKSRALVVTSNH